MIDPDDNDPPSLKGLSYEEKLKRANDRLRRRQEIEARALATARALSDRARDQRNRAGADVGQRLQADQLQARAERAAVRAQRLHPDPQFVHDGGVAHLWGEEKRRENRMKAATAPAAAPEADNPFVPELRDALTIFEAAMIYVAVDPHQPMAPTPARGTSPAERTAHARFYGISDQVRPGRPSGHIARDVLRELMGLVASKEVKPVRKCTFGNGDPDPLHTVIPLSAVLALARKRGDAIGLVAQRAAGDARHTRRRTVAPAQPRADELKHEATIYLEARGEPAPAKHWVEYGQERGWSREWVRQQFSSWPSALKRSRGGQKRAPGDTRIAGE